MLKTLSTSHKALIVTFISLVIIFIGFEFNRTGDFFIYISAAANYFSTPNLFSILYGEPAVFHHLGNPFMTLLLYPFTYLPIKAGAILFKLFNIALLIRVWGLVKKFAISILLSEKQNMLWQVLTFTSCLFVIYSNLHMIQFTICMLFFSLEGLYRITKKNQNVLGALLISLAIAIKISPVVLLPYLVYRRYFKASIILILLCISYYFIPVLFIGWSKNTDLWSVWWLNINPGGEDKIFDMNNRKNHGVSTWLSTLFIKDITDNVIDIQGRRHLVDLGRDAVEILIYAFRAFLILLTLYFLQTLPFKKPKTKLSEFREVSYLFLIIPLFFPQQRIYNFIFLLPAIAYVILSLLCMKKEINFYKAKLYTFCFAILLFNMELIVGVIRQYLWYYKSLTYATLVLLILLVILKPAQLSRK